MAGYICPLGIRTEIQIGQEGEAEMPWSEVCMHLRVAGRRMKFRVVPSTAWGAAVQLLRADGGPFSAPILTGEAGIYRDLDGTLWYYRPHAMGVAGSLVG